ncbi:unnamed protein product [Effrenium voratum]|nr:unnamed protein product [Effrenium voratum]
MMAYGSPKAKEAPQVPKEEPSWQHHLCDAVAVVMTWLVACCAACWRIVKRVLYPVKEYIFQTYDDVQQSLHPHTKGRKVPYSYTEVPGFRMV